LFVLLTGFIGVEGEGGMWGGRREMPQGGQDEQEGKI